MFIRPLIASDSDPCGTLPVTDGLITWLCGAAPGETALTWEDKSGLDNHWWANTLQSFPVHEPANNAMRFDAVDAWKGIFGPDIFSGLSAAEMFVNWKILSLQYWGYGKFSTGISPRYPDIGNTNLQDGWGSTVQATGIAHGTTLTDYHTYNVWSAANDYGMEINGVNKFTRGTNTVAFHANPFFGANDAGQPWHGWIRSIVAFNRKLDAGERTAINAYMDSL